MLPYHFGLSLVGKGNAFAWDIGVSAGVRWLLCAFFLVVVSGAHQSVYKTLYRALFVHDKSSKVFGHHPHELLLVHLGGLGPQAKMPLVPLQCNNVKLGQVHHLCPTARSEPPS